MITTVLQGGLGNQMFQYAIGRVMQIKLHSNLVLDISAYDHQLPANTQRKFELNIFKLTDNLQIVSKPLSKYAIVNHLTRLITKFTNRNPVYVREQGHEFHPEVLQLKGDLYFEGFWQTEKYFSPYSDIIRSDFSFKNAPSRQNQPVMESIIRSNSVSVHVRRGDYAHNQATHKFHGLTPIAYYQNAFIIIKQKVKNPAWYIFSDDPAWSKANIKPGEKTFYVAHNQGKRSWEDLRLMSSCKHHIIANSSFSWWGAWLGKYQSGNIIAPAKWFSDSGINTKDIYPKHWKKV